MSMTLFCELIFFQKLHLEDRVEIRGIVSPFAEVGRESFDVNSGSKPVKHVSNQAQRS